MSMEIERECPSCGETATFWKTAYMEIHLGKKTKWRCAECGYGYIQIDGDISTAEA
ncbi:DUF7838 family putative zinc beta-ribbon protein [Halogeometricum limi]|uniref:DUF7838 domain-containing protein n=1 Tax=Halogeometricum limi TaxID=555875 RepID=A0A1I6I4Z7_9EURY|nr:hypothetical protein [Halogeometricum limi]SFR61739.1 hypothetical protein SAMN04488124_2824 [Halogeometricum limi]